MDRRDFIKNALLLCGCSCLAEGAKVLYDNSPAGPKIDGIQLEQKHLIEKYKDKSELPRKICLDACSLCQLNCVCCYMKLNPHGVKNGCGLGYLKFENFKKLVDDNYIKEIELSHNGEIFLNPELLDIIKYAYEKDIKLTVYNGVNLNYLTDKMAEALVKYKVKIMTVSIDGATPETYKIYRRGGDFNTVINNIKKINYFKKKYNSEYPMLAYKFILFGHNEHEIDKAKLLAKKLHMHIKFDQNYNPMYSPVKNIELVRKKAGIDPVQLPVIYKAENYRKNHMDWFFCKQLWNEPQISWDGKVLGCCVIYDNDFGGNVFKDGLLKALNHPKMIYAKNIIANNAPPISGIPCSTCGNLSVLKKLHLTIKPQKRGADVVF